jgi:hypothetical protein
MQQLNEQDRVMRSGELTFTDEWAGTRIERIDSKYGNDRVYAIDGLGEYRSVTSSLGIINKPALADWRKNIALDKVQDLLKDPKAAGEYQKLADAKNAKARIHKNNTWVSMMIEEAKKAPNLNMTEARDFGNYAHSVVEHIAMADAMHDQEPFIIGPEYAHIAEGFQMWMKDSGMRVVASELMVWHPFYEYAGTIDLVCRNKEGMLAVVDVKTGGVYNEAAMQIAAYAKALQQLTGEEVLEGWALRLPRNRNPEEPDSFYEAYQLDDMPHWLDAFMEAHLLKPLLEKEAWQTI